MVVEARGEHSTERVVSFNGTVDIDGTEAVRDWCGGYVPEAARIVLRLSFRLPAFTPCERVVTLASVVFRP
jgi:hypothetical protein